jgi:hypothetical protein
MTPESVEEPIPQLPGSEIETAISAIDNQENPIDPGVSTSEVNSEVGIQQ